MDSAGQSNGVGWGVNRGAKLVMHYRFLSSYMHTHMHSYIRAYQHRNRFVSMPAARNEWGSDGTVFPTRIQVDLDRPSPRRPGPPSQMILGFKV